jgi:16S rRNA (guanine966-N2)-methyltransferase
MRIIAGEHRGRRLLAPPGLSTRPMLDRVREALFSTLGSARIEGARVLDLFSGSGSLGLEALSRGAAWARMIERDPRALAVLKQNIETLNVGERARVIRGDALKPKSWDDDTVGNADRYGVVFLDPPYAVVDDPNLRGTLVDALDRLLAERLASGGVLVLHAPARALELLRFRFKESSDLRVYGGSALLYLENRSSSVVEPP